MKGRGGLKVLGNSVLLQEPNSTGHGSVSSLQMQVDMPRLIPMQRA